MRCPVCVSTVEYAYHQRPLVWQRDPMNLRRYQHNGILHVTVTVFTGNSPNSLIWTTCLPASSLIPVTSERRSSCCPDTVIDLFSLSTVTNASAKNGSRRDSPCSRYTSPDSIRTERSGSVKFRATSPMQSNAPTTRAVIPAIRFINTTPHQFVIMNDIRMGMFGPCYAVLFAANLSTSGYRLHYQFLLHAPLAWYPFGSHP